jgi:hypothetical protein
MTYKIKIIDGVEWKECGPYCELCRAHMGRYYNSDGIKVEGEKYPVHFLNPHGYESYSRNRCPECGQRYVYEEGNMLDLSEQQLQLLRDDF